MNKRKSTFLGFLCLHTLLLILLGGICFLSLTLPIVIIKNVLGQNIFICAFFIILSILVFIYSYIFIIALLCYPLRRSLKPGVYNENSKEMIRWVILDKISSFLIRPPFSYILSKSALFYIPVFRLLGMKIHGYFNYQTVQILEPWFIEIGNNVVLGEGSCITGHLFEGGKLILGSIKIGNNVVIGIMCVISPNLEIGDNSVIGVNSFVSKNTKIPPNEVWLGIPARKKE